MPRLRFTVRRLVLAVAVIGIVIWAVRMRSLALRYRELAGFYAVEEALQRDLSGMSRENAAKWDARAAEERRLAATVEDPQFRAVHESLERSKEALASWNRTNLTFELRKLAYFSALQSKYERADRYPWLPVASDPPRPPDPPEPDGPKLPAPPPAPP